MPFITIPMRDEIAEAGYGAAMQVGDLCFIFYHEIMCQWFESPRWTTAHNLKKEYVTNPKMSKHIKEVGDDLAKEGKLFGPNAIYTYDDIFAAAELAYDVFFQYYVMPYEDTKREVSGDIKPEKSLRKGVRHG